MSLPVFTSFLYASFDFDLPYFRFDTERVLVTHIASEIHRQVPFVPKTSCGLSMPWDTGSQCSELNNPPAGSSVSKVKEEAKRELRKELEKKILVPMRTKLQSSGMIKPGGSAEQLLPSLDSVEEHYCGAVT